MSTAKGCHPLLKFVACCVLSRFYKDVKGKIMPLDPRYVIAPSLEQYYVDKDTGLPLANGVVTFYKDQARTELKPIFTISGSPPNYLYVQLPNPVTLSAVGTFQDGGGNNVIPYYFPYDDAGNVELYYITVYSEGAVLQFTREGWPNFSAGSSGEGSDNAVNYVPNGQFLLHNNIPASPPRLAGQISNPITFIAQGGWSFERPTGSIGTDFVLFPRYNAPINNPTANPRYAVRISTTVVGTGDLFKDLRLKFKDVNKFADTTQTFSFTAQTNTSDDLSLNIILIKNFGTGGSPSATTETVISTVMIGNTPSIVNQVINFGDNIGQSLGTNDDDFIQIAIRLPLAFIFDVTLTDVILTPGIVDITSFPQTTNSQFIYRTSGYMPPPNANGYDLYLPRIKTLEGERYDDSQIGQCVYQIRKNPLPGELRCDGSNYLYSGYSNDGIPYKRLGDVLLDGGNYPIFGTGANFVSSNIITNNLLTITTNTFGSATAATAATSGFTIVTRVTGNNYNVKGFNFGNGTIYIKNNIIGAVGIPAANTASPYLTVTDLRNVYQNLTGIKGSDSPGVSNSYEVFSVQVTNANVAIAGTYFTFSNTTTNYYVWFTVDGVGTDPAPASLTGIKIDLSASMDANGYANFIAETLGGHQVTTIVTTAATSITAGSYFTFSVNTTLINQNFYVWYIKDGVGVDPSPGGIGIPVNIVSADTNLNVATKTMQAINSFYVTVPDFRGEFIRIWNNGASNDPDIALRAFPYGQGQIAGDVIGSFQLDEIYSHSHYFYRRATPNPTVPPTINIPEFNTTQTFLNNWTFATGGSESRPINQYLNMFIKY